MWPAICEKNVNSEQAVCSATGQSMMVSKKILLRIAACCGLIVSTASQCAEVVCDIDVSGSQLRLVVPPNDDIYSLSRVDTPGDFRFAAQYLPALDKFKTYVYGRPKDKFVLLSAQEFLIKPGNCSGDFGRNRLYGMPYEGEFFYQCRLVCDH